MTKLTNVAVTFKFVKLFDNGDGEGGYGFFSLKSIGLEDAHFDVALLRQYGFDPADFSGVTNRPAVIDFESKDGKLHATRIYSIGDQAAGDPLPAPEVASAEESAEVTTAPKTGIQVGTKLTCQYKFGFDETGKFAEIAFFTPVSGKIDGKWDVLVPLTAISETQLEVLKKDAEQEFVVKITGVSEKGYVGEVYGLKLDQAKIKEEIAEREAEKAEKAAKKAAERQEERKRLQAREQLVVTQDGSWKLFGLPVTEADWPKLPDGTFVVLVEQFDEKTGQWSGLVSHFQVGKPGGTPKKLNERTGLSIWQPPVKEGDKPFVPVDTALCSIKVGGANVAMPVFEEKDRDRAVKLVSLLQTGRLMVDGKKIDHALVKVKGKYGLFGRQGPMRTIDSPQIVDEELFA